MPVIIILIGILIQIFLTVKKVSPFLSLLIVAITVGLMLGMSPAAVLVSVEKGVGSTLGGLALVLSLGAVLGKLLENSGAVEQITTTLIKTFGEQNIQWAVLLTGFLIGIPLYYNAGFIILVPLVFALAKKTGLPLLYIVIPMAAALSTTHCFLPPHPGPVVLVNAFKANMGKTLLYGLLIVMPTVIIAGPLLGRVLARMVPTTIGPLNYTTAAPRIERLPHAGVSFLVALLPVLLIAASVAGSYLLPANNPVRVVLAFLGESTIALLVAVLFAIYLLGIRRHTEMKVLMEWLSSAISGISMILLIITAGGVLKQVITDSGTAAFITSFSSRWNIPPLLFGWLVTALLRVTIGSATVAGLTAAGVVAPLVATGAASPELMVLAVGSGSVFGSHINDSGFWMFKEFFQLSMKQTFLSWSVMETVISLLGLAGVLLLNAFI